MLKYTFVGIWLDYRHADIFIFNGSQMTHKMIKSEISPHKTRGGSRSSTAWGPQQVVSESQQLNRRKQDIADYYDLILQGAGHTPEIGFVLFGPSKAKDGLAKVINAKNFYHPGVLRIITKDKMTLNQKKALVMEIFAELMAIQII